MDPGDDLETLLTRAGAGERDARAVTALVAAQRPIGSSQRAEVAILLGSLGNDRQSTIERITLIPDLGPALRIAKSTAGDYLATHAQGRIDQQAIRVRGKAGDGLYWSLRAAGVSPEAALEYLDAIETRLGSGAAVPANDRFDLVLAKRRGSSVKSNVLYAALDRAGGNDIQLVKWAVGDSTDWHDPNGGQGDSHAMMRPVAGPVTSRFGYRVHPILRFGRFHNGVDFQAPYGAPIFAASGGRVVAAGWNGGYGRQVRIAHDQGLHSSYSHMSRIVAPTGGWVRQGQVIGYVGSTGFTTGSHLHYEVIAGGRTIDPLLTRYSSGPSLNMKETVSLRKRLKQLLEIGEKRVNAPVATF